MKVITISVYLRAMKTNFVKIVQNLQSCTKQCLTLKWKSNIVEYECQGVNLLYVKNGL